MTNTEIQIYHAKQIRKKQITWLISGLAVGLTAMYFLDPQRGRYRRHVLRDRFVHLTRRTEELSLRVYRDVENRVRGMIYRAQNPLAKNVDDEIIISRIRAEFGKKVSHPRAVITDVRQGVVTLSGPILSSEVRPLVRCVKAVAGVKKVINLLIVHQSAGHISSLQGSGKEYLQ